MQRAFEMGTTRTPIDGDGTLARGRYIPSVAESETLSREFYDAVADVEDAENAKRTFGKLSRKPTVKEIMPAMLKMPNKEAILKRVGEQLKNGRHYNKRKWAVPGSAF